jgi:DNA polymerase-1
MIYFITKEKIDLPHDILLSDVGQALTYLWKQPEIQVDTETNGFQFTSDLLLIQLGTREHQYVFDVATVDITIFKELLETKPIILQNAKFDLRFLYRYGIVPYGNVFDTFLAESLLSLGLPAGMRLKNLDALAQRYLKITIPKDVRGAIHKLGPYDEKVIKYAANDVKWLSDIKRHQLKALEREDLLRAMRLENKFVSVLAYIEFCGFKIDQERWLKKSKADNVLLECWTEELNKMVEALDNPKFLKPPDLFNTTPTCGIQWTSAAQVATLMEYLGLDLTAYDKKTGEEKKSVEANVLKPQKDKHPIVAKYLDLQVISKIVSTYGESFLRHVNNKTGRIHTNYTQLMNTGRTSSGKDKEHNAKAGEVNMQNIPNKDPRPVSYRKLYWDIFPEYQEIPDDKPGFPLERACFVPDEGNVFIVSDYSSQESRILAEFSKEPRLVDFYLNGGADLHSYATQLVYPERTKGLTLKQVKNKFPGLRTRMKGFNFALAYGGTAITVAQNLNIPIEVAVEAEKDYFKAFPKLKEYFEHVKEETLNRGYIVFNPVSRHRRYFANLDSYKGLQNRLEAYFGRSFTGKSFKGLSSNFWDGYSLYKKSNHKDFDELKALLGKYFRLQGSIERSGLNYPIQGTAAAMSKLAGIYIFEWILEKQLFGVYKLLALVHDEYVTEAPKEISEECAVALQTSMEKAGSAFCHTIPITADPVISLDWKH